MKTKVTGYLTQKHGFYYVVLNLPTDEKGKRNRKTLSTGLSTDRNATKAKALLQTMIRAASAGEEVHGVKERVAAAATEDTEESWNTPHPNMLFSNYLEFWLQWKRKSWEEVTYSGYCQNVRSWIAPYFSARKVRLNEITVLDIEMFYTHEINKRGVSGNTVLHYHANIRKALSDAVKLKLIPYNPAAEVERPKKDNFVASYYSADELMEVLPIFANTKMELPVMLAAFYGLRRSEVIGLQWSAIDFERKIVTISRTFERINVDGKMVDVSKCRTKNKSSFRSLPLIPAVEQALLKAQKRQRQQMKLCGNSYCKEYKDYICVDDMGHLVTPDYVTRVFREMLLKNGFRPIRYHDLRHSCASLLIKNKVTMKEVQMWLGHSSFSTTANIYAHIDVDSKMEAANMIASKINPVSYTHLDVYKRQVKELHWIEEEEMLDLTAIAQSSPGSIAINASILVGYHVAGIPGALITVVGSALPPLIIISIISAFYQAFRSNKYVSMAMAGMLAGVAAVIFDVVINMAWPILKKKRLLPIAVMLAAFVATRFFSVNIILIILVCGVIGALDTLYLQKKEVEE